MKGILELRAVIFNLLIGLKEALRLPRFLIQETFFEKRMKQAFVRKHEVVT
jgi:hypothetical protein